MVWARCQRVCRPRRDGLLVEHARRGELLAVVDIGFKLLFGGLASVLFVAGVVGVGPSEWEVVGVDVFECHRSGPSQCGLCEETDAKNSPQLSH